MTKRIGANQRFKKNKQWIGKKPRNNMRGFIRQMATIGDYSFRFIVIMGFVMIIGLVLHFGKKSILPAFSEIEILKIKKIVVQGNDQIDSNTIISIAKIELDTTLSLITLPAKKIEDRLRTNCWIEDVNVIRLIPYTIKINIKERKPIAIVNIKNVYLIDKTGFLWPLKPHHYWDVPVVSGLRDSSISKNSPRLINHDLKRMYRFLDEIEKSESSIAHSVSQIDFSQEGIITVKLASNPITILLNELDVGRSLGHLNEILQRMENDSSLTTRYINLCFNNIAYINKVHE